MNRMPQSPLESVRELNSTGAVKNNLRRLRPVLLRQNDNLKKQPVLPLLTLDDVCPAMCRVLMTERTRGFTVVHRHGGSGVVHFLCGGFAGKSFPRINLKNTIIKCRVPPDWLDQVDKATPRLLLAST